MGVRYDADDHDEARDDNIRRLGQERARLRVQVEYLPMPGPRGDKRSKLASGLADESAAAGRFVGAQLLETVLQRQRPQADIESILSLFPVF